MIKSAREEFVSFSPSNYQVPDVSPEKFKLGKGFSLFDIDKPETDFHYFNFPVLLEYGPVSAVAALIRAGLDSTVQTGLPLKRYTVAARLGITSNFVLTATYGTALS